MATVSSNTLSLLELSKRSHRGSIISIAEVLTKINEIYTDIPFIEANGDTIHKYTRRASLPTGSRRMLNAGVAIESSKTTEHTAGIVLFESYSEIDERILRLSGNPAATRNSEALSFVEGISQTMVKEFFYGSKAVDPSGFDGFATQITSESSPNGFCIKNGAGTSGLNNTSVYIVQWAPEKVFGIYPKGSKTAGLSHKDLGEETKEYTESNVNKMYRVWRDQFQMDAGLVIKDPRCVGRLSNIKITDTAADMIDPKKLLKLIGLMDNAGRGTVIYCNRTVKYQLDCLAYDKSNGFYTAQNIFGEPVTMFRGIPIKLCEAIINTEAQMS